MPPNPSAIKPAPITVVNQPRQSLSDNRPGENPRSPNLEREHNHQYNLESQRSSSLEKNEVGRLTERIKPPNKFRYFIGFTLSGIGDILDIIATLSVVGAVVEWIVDIFIDAVLLPYIGLSANKNQKVISEAGEDLDQRINILGQRTNSYRQNSLSLSQRSKRARIDRISKGSKPLKAIGKIKIKNVFSNLMAFSLADLVPGLDLFPFRTYGTMQSYKTEKKAHKDFLEILENYHSSKKEEVEEFDYMLGLKMETET